MAFAPIAARAAVALAAVVLGAAAPCSSAASAEPQQREVPAEIGLPGSRRGDEEGEGGGAACSSDDEAACSDGSLRLLQRRARKASDVASSVAPSVAAAASPEAPLQDGGEGYDHLVLAGDAISVKLFLPPTSREAAKRAYYRSTRFDWGTMVGDIRFLKHRIMRSDVWRSPHDPDVPEAGVGIASEFGCGADSAECGKGWGTYKAGSSNGLLGYQEAKQGEPFLKIGVGKLLKGNCSDCKGGGDLYRFNSRYEFAEWPEWHVHRHGETTAVLKHEASLESGWGYRLQHRIEAYGRALTVETLLENSGNQSFRTPWYSHNFLNADDKVTGPPWAVKLPFPVQPYKLPAWSANASKWFRTKSSSVMRATDEMPEGAKVKLLFSNKGSFFGSKARGHFEATCGHLHFSSELMGTPRPLYDYTLFAERRTLSPEPQIMLQLAPGEYKLWRQVLTFR